MTTRSSIFDLKPEREALAAKFSDAMFYEGLAINPSDDKVNFILHIASVTPAIDALDGGSGPHNLSLHVYILDPGKTRNTNPRTDPQNIARLGKLTEKEFYEKYYYDVRNIFQNFSWTCNGAVSGVTIDDQVLHGLTISFAKLA